MVKWSDIYIGRKLAKNAAPCQSQYSLDNGGSNCTVVHVDIHVDDEGILRDVGETKYRVYSWWARGSSSTDYAFNDKNIREARTLLDELFPSDSMDRIDAVLQTLIDQQTTIDGFRFVGMSETNAAYVDPDGKKNRISKRKLADILDYKVAFPEEVMKEVIQQEYATVFAIKSPAIVAMIISAN